MNKDPSSFKLMLQYLLDAEFQASQPLDSVRVLSALLLTFVLASLIVVIYRICHRQIVTRAGSATAMVLVSMVTTLIIMPISTSIVLSLGMVGALSIVRFRTAMKDPADIAFLFWGIAIGVCNGAGFFNVSIVGTITIGLLVIAVARTPFKPRDPLLLVVRYAPSSEESLQEKLPPGRLLSKISRTEETELTLELHDSGDASGTTDLLLALDGVNEVSLVRYDGSFLSP
ncbi:MAG: DUF4956 domain-containing protein [Deltaproteobacteria bacterium]|jgi:hypothetical protein|nr:DUF4956 domain-containing protein [Deltaproteobacteria bacterium]